MSNGRDLNRNRDIVVVGTIVIIIIINSSIIAVAAAVTDTASCTFSITSSSVYRHSGGTHVIINIITTIMMTWQRMYMHHSETG